MRIGDPVYDAKGMPGVVVGERALDHTLQVNSDASDVRQAMRHGYIKGLDNQSREVFNAILDDVEALELPAQKVALLQQRIDEVGSVLSPRALQLQGYLKAQLSHVMNSNSYHPRHYVADATRL
jgi:hypothetical protein